MATFLHTLAWTKQVTAAQHSSGDLQLTWILCIAQSSSCALCLDVPTSASKPGGPESLVRHGPPCEEQHGHPRHAQGCTTAVWGAGQLLLHSCGPAGPPYLNTVRKACAAIWALPNFCYQNRALPGYTARAQCGVVVCSTCRAAAWRPGAVPSRDSAELPCLHIVWESTMEGT